MTNSPENAARTNHSIGKIGLFMAATGASLLAMTMAATAVAAVIWAFVKLVGLPDIALYVLLVAGLIPFGWVSIWTAGRAWHVERRLARGEDVDAPVFNLLHYFRKS